MYNRSRTSFRSVDSDGHMDVDDRFVSPFGPSSATICLCLHFQVTSLSSQRICHAGRLLTCRAGKQGIP